MRIILNKNTLSFQIWQAFTSTSIIKKHQKPSAENPQGAIVEKEAPIHASNVQVLDKNGVAGRVGYKVVDGKKVRYNKKSGEVLD